MWIEYNPNPKKKHVGDCAVRAITIVTDTNWELAYSLLTEKAFQIADMPSSNVVISSVLRQQGFNKANIPNTCPDCYTINDFCMDNKRGTFVLGTGTHVVSVINGNHYDSWDSGEETPIYVWYKDIPPVFNKFFSEI